ncbi:MAG: hypothetical protein JRC86_12185 [Deltaproteobacteria bacterium]|nr:hypothetical protein [Deltaproteobacteria bacterium]
MAQISCRQCCYSTPSPDGVDGTWHCEKHGKAITYADQLRACEHHLILPHLMPRWSAEWSGDSIIFSSEVIPSDGGECRREVLINGPRTVGSANYSSLELSVVPLTVLLNPFVSKAKALFDGAAIGEPQLDIMDRYPMEDCEVLWSGAIDADDIKAAWVAKVGHASPLVPLCSTNLPTHSASEYDEGFVVMADYTTNTAYILRGKQ